MDKYTELKDLAYKLDGMIQSSYGESKINTLNIILEGYKNEKISFEAGKELMYSIFRGEIDAIDLDKLKNEYEKYGQELAKREAEWKEEKKAKEEENKSKVAKKLENNIVYCIHCGTQNTGLQTSCKECGAILTHKKYIYCPNCGELNESKIRECIKCNFVINDVILCPVCKSSQVGFVTNVHNTGVSFAKAFWLEGLIGTAGSTALANKGLQTKSEFIRKCLNCGHEF